MRLAARVGIVAVAVSWVACAATASNPDAAPCLPPPSTDAGDAGAGTTPDAGNAIADAAADAVADASSPPVPVPDLLKAYVGGSSIALRWSERGTPGIAKHEIVRDGVVVASVTPGFHSDFPEANGNGYIDTDVTPGTTYAYRVRAFDENDVASELSAPLQVTHPASSTAAPTIVIDTSQAPDLADLMTNQVKPFLEIWYPKIALLDAQPDYTPPSSITLRFDTTVPVAATTNATTSAQPQYVRDNPEQIGMWLHEATHIIQQYGSGVPGWIVEGIADFSRDAVLHDRDLIPLRPKVKALATADALTYHGQYFLNWAKTQYARNLVHAVNVSGHNGYDGGVFQVLTGESLDALLQENESAIWKTGAVRFPNDQCLEGNLAANQIRVAACTNSAAQTWTSATSDYGWAFLVTPDDGCVDVQYSATANGSPVWTYSCNEGGAQKWLLTAEGKLWQPQAQRCLAIAADGVSLELQDCNNPAAPIVTLP